MLPVLGREIEEREQHVFRAAVNANQPNARERATYQQLVAMDRQSTVILGEPTVALPPC
jgi:hypothetical protein